MSIKLYIDSAALEKLFGGNTEAEVVLRQQVVEQFAKKYLKALFGDENWKKAASEWKADFEEKTKATNTKLMKELVVEAVEKVLEKRQAFLEEQIAAIFKLQMNTKIDEIVEREIHRRLEAAKRVRE